MSSSKVRLSMSEVYHRRCHAVGTENLETNSIMPQSREIPTIDIVRSICNPTSNRAPFLGRNDTMKIIGMMFLFVGLAGRALAEFVIVPEIDPGSATTALAMFTGALLVIRDRRNK